MVLQRLAIAYFYRDPDELHALTTKNMSVLVTGEAKKRKHECVPAYAVAFEHIPCMVSAELLSVFLSRFGIMALGNDFCIFF